MFTFPKWVLKTPKKQQATQRLTYILYRIALEHTPTPSLRSLCETSKVASNTTVSIYIERGFFSPTLAARFEKAFKIPASWLTDPMSMPALSAPLYTGK